MKTATNTLSLRKGPISRPQKAVLYGPEGVGKSTLAAGLPDPVFLDTEGGTHHLDVVRLDGVPTWEGLAGAVRQLATLDHGFRTLVIDTVDWLEKRLVEHLCRKHGHDSIEDFGYGKGYVVLAEEFAKFLASLDTLLRRGMHVVLLAHSTVRKFEAPDQAGSYDRYELKLSKQVAPLVKEWADVVLFANYVTKVAEKDSGRKRGVGGKERILFATHTAACDAKNRHGLPDKLGFSVEALSPVFGAHRSGAAPTVAKKAPAPAEKPAAPEQTKPTLIDRIFDAFNGDMANVVDFLVERGQLHYGADDGSIQLEKLDPAYGERMLADPKRFLAAVHQWLKEQEAAK